MKTDHTSTAVTVGLLCVHRDNVTSPKYSGKVPPPVATCPISKMTSPLLAKKLRCLKDSQATMAVIIRYARANWEPTIAAGSDCCMSWKTRL